MAIPKEFDPTGMVTSAQQLGEIQGLLTSGTSPIDPEVLRAFKEFKEAGVVYATNAMRVIKDPVVAAGLVRYASTQFDSCRLAFRADHSIGDGVILLVTPPDSSPRIDYVRYRKFPANPPPDWPKTDEERKERFLTNLEDETVEGVEWTVRQRNDGLEWWMTARRECLPEDIVRRDYLPSFVRRTIELCGKVREGLEKDTVKKQGILYSDPEKLKVMTGALQASSQMLQDVIKSMQSNLKLDKEF